MANTSTERSSLFIFTACKLITLILFPGALCFHVPPDKRPEISETKKNIYAKETLIAGVPLGKEETGNIFLFTGGRGLGQTQSFSRGSAQRDG